MSPETEKHLDSVASDLKQALKILMWATIGLYLVVVALTVGGLFWASADRRKLDVAIHNTDRTLCVYRADLQVRLSANKVLLLENPHGVRGVSAATIQSSIDAQQRAVNSLATLTC